MIWKTFATTILVMVASATLFGCSEVVEVQSEPGVADAQALIQEAVPRNSDGRLKLVSVTKTGGRRFKLADMDAYELWYNATAELTQDALWSPSTSRRFSTMPAGSKEGFLFHAGKAGEQVTIPGTLTFVKDKGDWKMQPDDRYQ
jgi:hypothetical protein